MLKKVLILLVLFFMSFSIKAQDWNEIYFLESEAHFLVSEFQYEKAIDNFKRILRDVPNHSLVKYHIGKTYLLTDDQKEKAVEFLEEASKDITKDFDAKSIRETKAPINALLYLGKAYQYVGRLTDAMDAYNKLKGMITPEDELFAEVNHAISTCENAQKALLHPKRISKKNLGDLVNDVNSNVNPTVSGDGNTLVFTTYKKDDIDLYFSTKEGGNWTTPKRITDKISMKYYLISVSLSYNGDALYLATNDIEKNDLFVSYRDGKNWTEAEKLDKTINGKKSNETHAVVTKDGKTLYFTSDREGGLGGKDIYKSTLNEKGKWGDPVNLGPKINTKFNEATPFLTLDDKYLFFSSEGHSSMGGYDVFYVDLEAQDQVINMGYPINTTGNDLFFVPNNSLTSGYMSIYDETSVGKNDIYELTILPKINIAGNILNSETKQALGEDVFSVSLLDVSTNNVVEMINSDNARFNFEVEPGKYLVSVNNENYEAFNSEIEIPDNYTSPEFNLEALLKPVVNEQEELVAEAVTEEVAEEQLQQDEPEVVEQVATQEEPVVETPVENPEEKLKEFVENKQKEQEQEVAEVVEEPEPIVEPEPEKKVETYVPSVKSTKSTTEKVFSVQLLALKKPAAKDFFKNLDGVTEKLHDDGYYRYTVGTTQNYNEAVALKDKMVKAGYKQAFIRADVVTPKYTIQLMALIIPVEKDYFANISDVNVVKGFDDYYRYSVGDFTDYNEAKQELAKISALGYKGAYVKKYY